MGVTNDSISVKPVPMPTLRQVPKKMLINGKEVEVKPVPMPVIKQTPKKMIVNGKEVDIKPIPMPTPSLVGCTRTINNKLYTEF